MEPRYAARSSRRQLPLTHMAWRAYSVADLGCGGARAPPQADLGWSGRHPDNHGRLGKILVAPYRRVGR
jgi:hypothetical protein